MRVLSPRIAIIGGGNVGIRTAYALSMRGIARQIVIVDRDRRRLEGNVMDISHGAPYTPTVDIVTGEISDIAGSSVVIITAGIGQRPGQTRIDLVKENIALYRALIPAIVAAAPDAILLVVTNPVDVLSYAAHRISGKPAAEVIGSGTVLDTARLRFLMAQHCEVDPHNIHAYILGEHGDTEFPVWSRAMIGGVMLNDYCTLCRRRGTCDHHGMLDGLFREVRDSAYHIIERKGETSYGIALALTAICRAIINDEHAVLPVSSLVDGYLDMRDVYASLPAVVHRRGVREVLTLDLSPAEQQLFRQSAQAIKDVLAQVGF